MPNNETPSPDNEQGSSTDAHPLAPDPVRVDAPRTAWFDRPERITLNALLIGVPIVIGVPSVIAPILDWIRDRPITAAATGDLEFPNARIDSLSSLHYDSVSATVYLDHPGVAERLVGMVLPLIGVALLAFGAVTLLRVTRDVAGGHPFSQANVQRLRLLAVAIFAMGLFSTLVPPLMAWAFVLPDADAAEVFAVQAIITLNPLVLSIIAGLAVLMLGQAFAAGRQLADDAAEVI